MIILYYLRRAFFFIIDYPYSFKTNSRDLVLLKLTFKFLELIGLPKLKKYTVKMIKLTKSKIMSLIAPFSISRPKNTAHLRLFLKKSTLRNHGKTYSPYGCLRLGYGRY